MSPHLRQPRWMRPFIEEPAKTDDDFEPKTKQGLPYVAILLLILAVAGFVLQALIKLAPPSILLAVAALYLALFRPRTASIFLLLVYTTLFVLQVALLATNWKSDYHNLVVAIQATNIGISVISIATVVNLPLRNPSLPRDEISRPFAEPKPNLRSPEDNLTLWQWMTVSWMSSLIAVGKKRQLNEDDVWLLGYEFQHRHLHDSFRELHGTVVRRLIRANWIDLALLTILAILELVANYSAPVLLQQLLRAMNNLRFEKAPAMTFALLILVVRLIAAQSAVFSLWFGRRSYERSRGEMITMLYEKTLNRKIIATVKDNADDGGIASTGSGGETNYATSSEAAGSERQGLLNGHNKPDEKKSFFTKIFDKTGLSFARRKKKVSVAEDNAPASMGKILNLMRGDVYEVRRIHQ